MGKLYDVHAMIQVEATSANEAEKIVQDFLENYRPCQGFYIDWTEEYPFDD